MTKPYAPAEEKILKFLRKHRGKKVTTHEVVDNQYQGRRKPKFPRQTVTTLMNNLIAKVSLNREDFRVVKTEHQGPYPSMYWIEKTKTRREGK